MSTAEQNCGTSVARADEKPDRITVATWNLEWFYDHEQGDNYSKLGKKLSAPSKSEWDWRVEETAAAIAKMNPTILALQEVENRKVLFDLKNELKRKHNISYRIAYIEGFDRFTEQDVAILFQGGLVEFSRKEQSYEMWSSKEYSSLTKHLFAKFQWGQGDDVEELVMLNVHLKATKESEPTRKKQLKLARKWLEKELEAETNVILIGDFNTEEFAANTQPNSDIGLLSLGDPKTKLDDLVDLHRNLSIEDRKTHMIGKEFDHILINAPLAFDSRGKKDLVFKSIRNYKNLVIRQSQDKDHRDLYFKIPRKERDLSDHYPIMATFEFK